MTYDEIREASAPIGRRIYQLDAVWGDSTHRQRGR